VLDMGCSESTCAIELASLGYQVVGVDLRRLPVEHPNFRMVQANLAELPFPDGSFDVVVCLSTIEHVGLSWYADVPAWTTDYKAAEEAWRVLRPGGRLVLTLPYGKPAETPVHRIYDAGRLDKLLEKFRRLETAYGVRDGESWTFTTDAERAGAADSAERVSAVALVAAEKA
jgi:SAM-dependent methyltransferase